jgi:xanthine/CO dehydrogenase XdhC/CoxF family maturation factor
MYAASLRTRLLGATGAQTAHPTLAVVVAVADAEVRTFHATVAAALAIDIARSATLLTDAGQVFAVVAVRAPLRVLATVRAVPIAMRAAATLSRTRPALAVVVAVADARVRTLGAAVAAALATDIARGATLLIDTREVFAVVAGRAALRVLAAVRAVPIATRTAATIYGTRPAPAVVVAAADAGVGTFDPTVAAAAVIEIAGRAARPTDAGLVLSASGVVGATLSGGCVCERS